MPGTPPDNHGWDTVLAIRVDEVNKYLQAVGVSDQFVSTIDKATDGFDAAVTWKFANWRVTDVRGGARVVMAMEFADGSKLVIGGTETLLDKNWTCAVTFEAHFARVDAVTRNLVARTEQGQDWAIDLPPRLVPAVSLDCLLSGE
jgi:hypothetical protein